MSERWGGYRTTEHFRRRMDEMGLNRQDIRPVLEDPDLTYEACERRPGQNPKKDSGTRVCGHTPAGVAITVVVENEWLITVSPWMSEGYAHVRTP